MLSYLFTYTHRDTPSTHTDLIKVPFPSRCTCSVLSESALGWIHSSCQIRATWATVCMATSVCSCHPSNTFGDRKVQDVIWEMHKGLTCCNSSSHHQPSLPSLSQEAPVLLACLIMWARCLWVSLCHPVALSANIMPPSGRLAAAAHSSLLFFCVYVWMCEHSLLIQKISFPLPAEFVLHS